VDYCRRVSAPVTFVSAYIYGKPERLPVREDDTPRPNNPYALSKYLAEQLCEFGARYNGLNVTVVRPFNIYGPAQPEHFLIPIVLRQLQARGAIQLKDLSPKRDYIHVDDLVRLLVQTLTPGTKPYRVVNAGSGESHSVREIVDTLQAAAGTNLPVLDEGAARYEELPDVRGDISFAEKEFGWSPRISLRSGLDALVQGMAPR
jgi:nucleoside-diphosphate-sugar epimerase